MLTQVEGPITHWIRLLPRVPKIFRKRYLVKHPSTKGIEEMPESKIRSYGKKGLPSLIEPAVS